MSRVVSITIILSERDAALLRKPVNGEGGYQSFLRSLQNELTPLNKITLSGEQIKRIYNYAIRYGKNGGYQQRLNGILNSIAEATDEKHL